MQFHIVIVDTALHLFIGIHGGSMQNEVRCTIELFGTIHLRFPTYQRVQMHCPAIGFRCSSIAQLGKSSVYRMKHA